MYLCLYIIIVCVLGKSLSDYSLTLLSPTISPGAAPKKRSPATKKVSPSPAPAPGMNNKANPPGCVYGRRFPRKAKKQSHVGPPVLPPVPWTYAAPSPMQQVSPPASVSYLIPAPSPLPKAVYAQVRPPPSGEFDAEPPDITHTAVSPSSFSSSTGLFPTGLPAVLQFLIIVYLL